MSKKRGPFILLSALIIVLAFIVGVRYGQTVEKANKVIDYLNKLALTPSPTPVKPTPIEFKTYQNKICGVSFLYPSSFSLKDATNEAVFADESGAKQIDLSCPPLNVLRPSSQPTQPTPTPIDLTFKSQTIKANLVNNQSMYDLHLVNPKNGKSIEVIINTKLYALFEKSLSY